MAGWRRAVDLAMTAEEIETLTALSRSRTEAARHVERAQMLLAYRQQRSFFAVGQRLGVHHQTVQRCVERAVAYGALAALDDRPRPGKEPVITPEARLEAPSGQRGALGMLDRILDASFPIRITHAGGIGDNAVMSEHRA